MKPKILFVLIIFAIIGFGFHKNIDPQSDALSFVVPKMISEIESHPDLIFIIKNCERIDDELLCGQQKVFLRSSPFKCRIIMIDPNLGDQIIYDEESGPDAKYVPIGFPFVSMDLDPLGERMRKNNHHSIFELGFGFFSDITAHYYENYRSSFVVERNIDNGKTTYTVTSRLSFKYKKYVAKKKETPRSIAHRKIISEYLIYEKNNFRESYKEGDTVLIPNHYYKKFQLILDGGTFLPTMIKVYDDKGLFEKYEFSKVELDPVFNQDIFSK